MESALDHWPRDPRVGIFQCWRAQFQAMDIQAQKGQGSRDTAEVPREDPCYAGSRSSAGLQLYPRGVEVGCRAGTMQPMLAPDLSLQPLML